MEKTFSQIAYTLIPVWDRIRKIRTKVKENLTAHGFEAVAEDAMMVASELCENAVKYGSVVAGTNGKIDFNLTINGNRIGIEVSNGVVPGANFDNVKKHIDLIKASDDPSKLYVERLSELMESTGIENSRLGLYRVAYEGEFSLDYIIQGDILKVIAERSV